MRHGADVRDPDLARSVVHTVVSDDFEEVLARLTQLVQEFVLPGLGGPLEGGG